ncbi:FAD-binding and (Fe-S)-binding domain-containing protein [Leifsonia sp. H3M29-4]|uniref:FAD-binding and (Fe-S)-binding domain-containing protein n=1 Tax=Salinibacterium metalliresistens TaxID=3031321 RepID=UPI0023DC1C7E|nr:FAD-binding and (Fe-S)-binding domain-containing protein [Salinibacterium metalliresistens]MDF1479216.1 FAD-binding and (Fe-S)-binding domain-containing protein [Salinibacterium metalliresistens]
MSLIESASRADLARDETTLGAAIGAALPRHGAVSTSSFDRVIAAVDASHYLLTPRAVVTPKNAEEVAALFAYATAGGEALTFRSGGTSLSGQASTGSILVDTRKFFRSISIEEDGLIARVGPGATVRQVNARLLRHGRKLGPDPASEIACTIGGVVANNSSGMACGTEQNTYRTLRSAVIVLPSGTIVDTSLPDADDRLREREPALWRDLATLRRQIMARPELVDEIVRQYGIKNTMGYGLNSLVDYEAPADILAHLIIGSEGTLGFVAEATFNTVPLLKHAATTLLVFDTLRAATDALVDIIATSPTTIELMDAASLRAALIDPESRDALPSFDIVDHCALLVEYQAADVGELFELSVGAEGLFARLPLTTTPVLTRDPKLRASLWHIRKGLYATVAGARPSGTTALLEDIAVPVARLSETCAGLTRLFAIHGYDDAVIFGHAKDGNVHFLINEDFESESNLARYRAFTEDMVELVLTAGGTLKAEHGTGRIMAPFVERQYGPELYGIMLDIKAAFDPAGILNPDTILTEDADLHLRNLKSTPTIEVEADRCVECGYCEPVCPSKDLTTTPRQRIVVSRAIAEADQRGDAALAKELRAAQGYDVIDTCAVDGMCQTACPVLINTGDLVRRLRSETVGAVNSAVWNAAGKAWGPVTGVASLALSVASAIPAPLITAPNKAARAVVGSDVMPLWSKDLPKGGSKRRSGTTGVADAVYFQACVGTMFGPAEGGEGVAVAFQSLAEKAGIGLVRPEGIGSLCCGTPWKSKGMLDGYHDMVARTADALWVASDHGRLPIVCDNSSCSEGLVLALEKAIDERPDYHSMRIIDAVDFAAEHILPNLVVDPTLGSIVVHPTCSSTRAGSNANLATLAAAVSGEVTVPDDWGCCAFAGDRGMLHPELTASATARESAEVGGSEFDAYVSCNRTCEIGMTRATGHDYQHILEVLDRAASPVTEEADAS